MNVKIRPVVFLILFSVIFGLGRQWSYAGRLFGFAQSPHGLYVALQLL